MNSDEKQQKCGFVAICGLPNAGKSTLVNKIVGEKVVITSPKRGTTRARTLGIALKDECQLILIDTPGLEDSKTLKGGRNRLERSMNATAWEAVGNADASLLLVDTSIKNCAKRNKGLAIELAQNTKGKIFLALNKIDKVSRQALLPLTAELSSYVDFKATFMIAARRGDGVDDLSCSLFSSLSKSPWLFPEDQVTDAPARLAAAEIVREQIFRKFHAEIPYSTMVETEGWEEFDNGSVKISATICVQRPSQKAIILGKGGASLKAIGTAARHEISRILERRVHLKLFVKVEPNWPEQAEALRTMGLM